MDGFVRSLVAVIEVNQRFLFRRIITQVVLLTLSGVGLWKLSGGWWWLCLFFFLVFCLNTLMFTATLLNQFTVNPTPPWRALGLQPQLPGVWSTKGDARMLELHLLEGGTSRLPVPVNMVPDLLDAAREAGLEVITDEAALKELDWESERVETLRKLNMLSRHVATAELREEIGATVLRLRELAPRGCDELLRDLETLLRAVRRAQIRNALRGQRDSPVYEQEIREKLAALAKVLA